MAQLTRELRFGTVCATPTRNLRRCLPGLLRCSPFVSHKQAVSSKFPSFAVDPGEKGVDGRTRWTLDSGTILRDVGIRAHVQVKDVYKSVFRHFAPRSILIGAQTNAGGVETCCAA